MELNLLTKNFFQQLQKVNKKCQGAAEETFVGSSSKGGGFIRAHRLCSMKLSTIVGINGGLQSSSPAAHEARTEKICKLGTVIETYNFFANRIGWYFSESMSIYLTSGKVL